MEGVRKKTVARDVDRGPGESVPKLAAGVGADLKALALGARLLGPVVPGLAGRLAYGLWFRTVRPPDPPSALPVLRAAERSTVDVAGVPVTTYAWGQGPVVLLVHGWSSHTAYMTGFVDPLIEHGFRVVAFDAPAHGRTPGDRTDIFEIREALLAVAGARSPLRGVVAHSLGSLAFLDAQSSGLHADACVLISPGVHLDALVGAFTGRVGLSGRTAADLKRRVASFVGADFYDRLWDGRVPAALVVHDQDDEDIPWDEGRRVARKLDADRLRTTEGLGHRRILRDSGVLVETARFLSHASVPVSEGGEE